MGDTDYEVWRWIHNTKDICLSISIRPFEFFLLSLLAPKIKYLQDSRGKKWIKIITFKQDLLIAALSTVLWKWIPSCSFVADLVFFSFSSSACWPLAQLTRPARSGGRPISPWWRSSASRATTQERRPEVGCGTVRSPETLSTSLPVSAPSLSDGFTLEHVNRLKHRAVLWSHMFKHVHVKLLVKV